jgi:hypothetical protein
VSFFNPPWFDVAKPLMITHQRIAPLLSRRRKRCETASK